MATKHLLVTGSAEAQWLNLLFETLFQLKYTPNEDMHTKKFSFTVLCDLNRLHFDFDNFRQKCSVLKSSGTLEAIMTIENLNPRPETLFNDVNILIKTFSPDYLKKYLYVFFTFSNHENTLKSIREDVMKYDAFFNLIKCNNEIDKETFVKQRVWILNRENLSELKELPFLKVEPVRQSVLPSFNGNGISRDHVVQKNEEISSIRGTENTSFQLKLTRIKQKKIVLIRPCIADSALLNQPFEEFFVACDYIYNCTASYNYSDAVFLSSLANDSRTRDHYLSSTPIDAFFLLIKIDKSKTVDFLDSAEKFVSSFGSDAIKSLILLCIKTYEKDFYSQDDYRQCLEKTEGYKYLKSENEGSLVLACLWDRKFVSYNQQIYFDSCLSSLKPFDKTMMKYSFKLIEKDIKYEQLKNETEKKSSIPGLGILKKFRT